jgi:spore germination protein GerM
MQKKSKKKKGFKKFIFLIFIIGVIGSFLYLFHDKIFDFFRAKMEKRRVFKEQKEIVLYFMDNESEYLVGEKRKIEKKGNLNEEAKALIDELIKGPKKGLIPTLPSKTKCLNLRLNEKGLAIVNFNNSLSKDHPGGSSAEMVTVYSIVNSLVLNFPEIKRVQILIDGRAIDTISGHLLLRYPLNPKLELIKRNN